MDLRKIKTLISLFEESNLDEMEVTAEEESIRLVRNRPPASAPPAVYYGSPGNATHRPGAAPAGPAPDPATPAPSGSGEGSAEAVPAEDQAPANAVPSPLVGTFYRKPSPDAEAFVKIGDKVKQGDTLCIIEAMKVMNQIKAPHAGRVVNILVDDGAPVEYGQPLVVLE
ncbi:MAG: acetyl-CoA carboxylase biotin carboxyl carrier protein [Gammaproteobacteria bacterium AqS3]|nr:acetyl-CoA carboxylase biotin carboxyl carrier protein [Gammaproteobacteria bacterium AqS3]